MQDVLLRVTELRATRQSVAAMIRPAAILLCLLATLPSVAQQSNTGSDSQQQTIQILLQRIEKLEARVTQLESAKQPGIVASAPASELSGPPAEPGPGPVADSSEAIQSGDSQSACEVSVGAAACGALAEREIHLLC